MTKYEASSVLLTQANPTTTRISLVCNTNVKCLFACCFHAASHIASYPYTHINPLQLLNRTMSMACMDHSDKLLNIYIPHVGLKDRHNQLLLNPMCTSVKQLAVFNYSVSHTVP